ncbi:glycosyltransferase family 8 protein [Novipirellula artificiosorum]|uniref:General stress protein A n=1 Tax=Novipirellula artificiosorum TaxID=2528016 RepID=A0A5C6DRM8_9BACT|nr:glycosyltransferase family 8 protein [Novipirellula artificiosorum]TWU37409.1 General stress protein A [Novipirellula artificiosorum]
MPKPVQNSEPLVVVTGADENYAIGLVVTIRSMLCHLDPGRRVQLHVFDGGIQRGTKNRILKSWADRRLEVHWHDIEMSQLSHLVTSGYLNHTTYLRLLIPSLVPPTVEKVIYLDSDLLVRKDISILWEEPMEDHSALAALELASPYVDAEVVFANQPLKHSRLGTATPIANYRELHLDPRAKVFNAGMLVINVAQWRQEQIPEQAYQCLEDHRDHVLYCDQYALNVVLHGKWRELDSRWNQTAHYYAYKCCDHSPLEEPTFSNLANDPWICHFTWIHKPWFRDSGHPFGDEFVWQMRQTAWARYRLKSNPDHPGPARQRRTMKQWLERRVSKAKLRLARLGMGASNQDEDRRAA